MRPPNAIREALAYCPETGVFTWIKVARNRFVKAGDRAGSPMTKGYINIRYKGNSYKAHRLAWFFATGVWPDCDIDHINHVVSDNRLCNLRLATRSQNGANRRVEPAGVSRCGNRWQAFIRVNLTRHYLGSFETRAAARAAYLAARMKHFGEFAGQT